MTFLDVVASESVPKPVMPCSVKGLFEAYTVVKEAALIM